MPTVATNFLGVFTISCLSGLVLIITTSTTVGINSLEQAQHNPDVHSENMQVTGESTPEDRGEFPWSLHHFLPFWAGADHHDLHHEKFIGNYSSSFRDRANAQIEEK
jgi:hypothetical protein